MNDSEHPLYKLGYRRGRQRTYAEKWNEVYLRVLPVALQMQGWTLNGESVSTSEQRIELARRWANKAVTDIK